MKRLFLVISVTLLTSLFLAACVYAEVPHLIRFQGKVTDDKGKPLEGAYNITFRIYNAETGGTLMWSETQLTVPVNNGIFTVLLGDVADLDLAFDEPYWLSMEVSDDGEMFPRQRISSVGYAIHAEVADSITNVAVVPKGAIIIWRGASCPVGYSRVAELDGKFLVSGPAYNPAAGGSNTHNHGGTTGSHTLTVTEIPPHTHNYSKNAASGYYGGGSALLAAPPSSTITGSTGGGQGHTHTILSTDSRPEFATVILCEKD